MNDKLVSVYIPTHFRPDLLDRAIKSIFIQTYKNVEVVICVDGYCSDSIKVINKWIIEGYNIKFHCENFAKGACFCRNKAIEICSGDYITGLDDDDYFEEDRIKSFVDNFTNNDEILYTNYKVRSCLEKLTISPAINVNERLYEFNYIGNQIFFHKSIKRHVIFDEEMPAWQDYEAWLSLYDKGHKFRLISIPNYVVDLTHPHERITKNSRKVKIAYGLIISKHSGFLKEPNSTFLKYSLYRYPSVKMNYKHAVQILKNMGMRALLKLIVRRIIKS